MIPFLFIGGGLYFLFDALGNQRPSVDPADLGLPTKGFRGYRRGAAHFAKGGVANTNPYEEFLLTNGFEKAFQRKNQGFTQYRKGRWYAWIDTKTKEVEVGKYDSDIPYNEVDGFREDNAPYYHTDRYTNSLSKFKKFLHDNYILD